MLLTPVAFFIFNRPDTTRQVFENIRAEKPAKLLIVADGPRASRPDDAAKCAAARRIVERIDWPCEVLTNFSSKNLGCRQRLSSGLTWVFDQCEEAIILEDDCLPSPSFFSFCTELLRHYRTDQRVMHIAGSNFQAGQRRGAASYYFSRAVNVWGWATWRRAWQHYDVSISRWPDFRDRGGLRQILTDSHQIAYYESELNNVFSGALDTWDYQWQFACWLQNGVAVQPNVNLITNIGFGPDATHTTEITDRLRLDPVEMPGIRHPTEMLLRGDADAFTFYQYFGGKSILERRALLSPLKHRLRRFRAVARRALGC